MTTTAVYTRGRFIGSVIWSGKHTEVPVNLDRFFAHHCFSWDEQRHLPTTRCSACGAMRAHGVFLHDTGCPNTPIRLPFLRRGAPR